VASRILVVPCYNEASRLDVERWVRFAEGGPAKILFVDDGSRDDTLRVLGAMHERSPERVEVLHLSMNGGKGEAVRAGLRRAIELACDVVGYSDADLATPPDEIARLFEALDEEPELLGVIGSRIKTLGTHIERRAMRHYLGRVFATGAAVALGRPVYDTQCGAKVFRAGATLARAIEEPFVSRWAFDVELLARLFEGAPADSAVIHELPLRTWVHVAGSKLSASGMVKASLDLARIGWKRRRGR
jgi:glycosyltransferase involved in cell wall biosynthesis